MKSRGGGGGNKTRGSNGKVSRRPGGCGWWFIAAAASLVLAHNAMIVQVRAAATQREILGQLYASTNGASWTTSTYWNTAVALCDWHGVTCANGPHTAVTSLSLGNNNLSGSLPMFALLTGLPRLNSLDVKDNPELDVDWTDVDSIPTTTDDDSAAVMVANLTMLYLSGTGLTSLDGIGHIRSLHELHLTNSTSPSLLSSPFSSSGTSSSSPPPPFPFPTGLYDLPQLRKLFASFNPYAGQLTPSASKWRHLRELYLYQNSLTGPLPTTLGSLTNLQHLVLGGNDWTGRLPPQFARLTQLRELSIRNERDDGVTPGTRGLMGPLPSFANFTNLVTLHLNNNGFTGTVPSDLLLDVNTAAMMSATTGGDQKVVISINLTHNDLDGQLPSALATRFSSSDPLLLQLNLDVTGNRITGPIPEEYCSDDSNNVNPGWNNGLVGKFGCDALLCPPGTHSRFGRKLDDDTYDCDECLIHLYDVGADGSSSSSSAEWLGRTSCTTEREVLMLLYERTDGRQWYSNDYWGSNDVGVCGWYGISCGGDRDAASSSALLDGDVEAPDSGVTSIDLSHNLLRGTVPKEIFALPALSNLDLSRNDGLVMHFAKGMGGGGMGGMNDGEVGGGEVWPTSHTVTNLALSGTEVSYLRGISRVLPNLEGLHLSENGIGGPMPIDDVVKLTHLTELDMSNNQMMGELSGRIGDLVHLNLNNNILTGPIPSAMVNLTKLKWITVANNRLNGPFPSNLFNGMSDLETLSLRNNRGDDGGEEQGGTTTTTTAIGRVASTGITGPLPDFAGLNKLKEILLDGNSIVGSIPPTFLLDGSTQDVVRVSLANNLITGTLPSELATRDITSLTIDLRDNEVKGISPELCNMTDWMEGDVGVFGCDAILCPSGTYNEEAGRRRRGEQSGGASASGGMTATATSCAPCASARFLGSTNCSQTTAAANAAAEGVVADERDILRQFYEATGGTNWDNNENWLKDDDDGQGGICDWFGITCEREEEDGDNAQQSVVGGRVAKIDLLDNNLVGSVPSSTFRLPALRTLNLMRNDQLAFSFDGIDAATELTDLYLSETGLTSIDGVSMASGLRVLHMARNNVTGSLPEEVFQLTDLMVLDISRNLFTGKISENIGNLVNLTTLNVNHNMLAGHLPTTIGNLRLLKELSMSKNSFSGRLPGALRNLKSLEVLSLREQRGDDGVGITGGLLGFSKLTQLFELDLGGNSLTGSIPSTFLSGSSVEFGLIYVNLASNRLSGTLPKELGRFKQLIIDLQDNQIEGIAPNLCNMTDWMDGDIGEYGCDALLCAPGTFNTLHGRQFSDTSTCQDCPESTTTPYFGSTACVEQRHILEKFYRECGGDGWWNSAHWNDANVDVCDWYGISCRGGAIEAIHLGANNIVGTPPAEIFNLPNLRVLWLYSNPIEFSFEGIGNAKNLTDVLLDSTGISALDGLGQATNLVNLDLRFNSITGPFPYEEISKLVNLRMVQISDNELSGELKSSLLTDLGNLEEFKVSKNSLSGRLPDFSGFSNLKTLDLAKNSFTGEVPPTFMKDVGDLSEHIEIDISFNRLSGTVPLSAFGKFEALSLYMRDNSFEGLEESMCERADWNDGQVGKFGCDAILCPHGTFNDIGRQREDARPCEPCEAARFLGSSRCPSAFGSSSSASSQRRPSISSSSVIFPAVVLLAWGLC